MNILTPDEILDLSHESLEKMSIEELLEIAGGWNVGHTEFTNGWHGDGWFEKGFIIRYPNLLNEVTRRQAGMISNKYGEVDLLVGRQQRINRFKSCR